MTNKQASIEEIYPLLDITRLEHSDTVETIQTFVQDSVIKLPETTASGLQKQLTPAALCVLPRFVPYVREFLDQAGLYQVAIASVANFPTGDASIDRAVAETKACVAYGANEVDLVFPYAAFVAQAGSTQISHFATQLITACKATCGANVQLKVILETSDLKEAKLITQAAQIAIQAGADFLKTSTGFNQAHASPEAVELLLEIIAAQDAAYQLHAPTQALGIKISGGIHSLGQATAYLAQVKNKLAIAQPMFTPKQDPMLAPSRALTPARVRIGASRLHLSMQQQLAQL